MALASLAPLHGVMGGPTLPGIKATFGVSRAASQQAMTIFLLGLALSQLLFGPPANVFGRVKTLFVGLTLGVVGTVLNGLSASWGSFEVLLAGRFVAGIGTASSVVISYAIVHDVFAGKRMARVLGLYFAAIALMPAFGTLSAGFLIEHFEWPSVFYALAVYTAAVGLWALTLPETLPSSRRVSFRLMSTLRAYGHALRNPTLVVSGIQFALGLSILYGTVALLPFLALHRLHMTAATYGSVFFISYLGYFVGALFCIATAGRLEATRAMLIGICVTLIGGLAFGALALTHSLSIPGVFSCVFVIFLGLPIVFSNASALGVVKHDDKAIGSAVYAFIYGFGACVSLAVAGSIHGAYDLVLPAWTVGLMLIALTLYFAFTTRERRGRAPRSSGTII